MRARGSGGGRIGRRLGLRTSLAGRLLAGGLLFTALLIAGVSGFLLVSRTQQTSTGALSNADNRAGVAAQLIARVTEPQAQYAATDLASLTSLQMALAGSDPAGAVAAEFSQKRVVSVPGLDVVVLDAHGAVLYTTECDSAGAAGTVLHPATAQCEASAQPHVNAGLGSVRDALAVAAKAACQEPATLIAANPTLAALCPSGAEGTELLTGGLPSFDVAVPVLDIAARTYAPLGVVVYAAPLRTQFTRFGPVIGYAPVFLATGANPGVIRFAGTAYAPQTAGAPAGIARLTSSHTATSGSDPFVAHGIYAVEGSGDVAGSFVPLSAPGGSRVAGYLGVEVPLSQFAAGTAQDERTIAQIAFTALVVVCVLVLFFVDRFVRRPVGRLERGVARIAAGDYATDIPVTSRDELGRLAAGVNRMRDQIAGYIKHIDGSIVRLQEVSRALTATTGGIERLEDAVLSAASAIAGGDATAMLFMRRGGDFAPVRTRGRYVSGLFDQVPMATLLAGHAVRLDEQDRPALAVPMLYQGSVTAVLMVVTDRPVAEVDERALITLANSAAIAIENTRVLEQERQAVQRLRELNQLKGDFLNTAQHELRTPVLAIQGQIELLTVAWEKWDDATKLDMVRDIDISGKLLGEVVENIVDFSLLNAETIDLRLGSVDVAQAVEDAAGDVRKHFKHGLPVELTVDVRGPLAVSADPSRFRQVIRSLLDNAVKFTPEGGHVTVTAGREKGTARCRIEVIDDGIGIGSDSLPRVFDRFFQEDNSRTRRFGGMGMGLALVRRLCDAHGATVKAESVEGRGSRFTLLWSLADAGSAPAPSENMFFEPVARG